MTPELKFAITAQNKSSAVLKQVRGEVEALGRSAPGTGRNIARMGEDIAEGARFSRNQMLELGHSARATFDILASGGSPMRALALEGPRLAQALGGGPGGLGGSFKALAPLLLPVAGIAAAVGVGFAGLTHELDKTTGKNITFMETVKAVGQAIWADLVKVAGPAVQQLGKWFGQFIDWIAPAFKTAGNFVVNTFSVAFADIRDTWSQLPAALGDLAIQGAQKVLDATVYLMKQGVAQINDFLTDVNALSRKAGMGNVVGLLGQPDYIKLSNPNQGAAAGVGSQFSKNAAAGYAQDPMGAFYGQIQGFALQNNAADNAATGVDKLGKAFKGLTDAEKAAKKEFDFYQSTFSGFFTSIADDLRQGTGFWDALGNAASNALGSIADHLLQLGGNDVFSQLFGGGGLLGGLFGGVGFGGAGNFSIGGMATYASGTSSARGGVALVGERGPELVNLSPGAQVFTASQTSSLLGRAANGAANSNNHFYIDARGAQQGVGAEIAQAIDNYDRHRLPGRVAQINGKPSRQG